MSERYITYSQLREIFPFLSSSRAGRALLIKRSGFPPPRYIGANTPVWRVSEVEEWIENRPRSHSAVVSENSANRVEG
jgi:predicted DNA-binding transcriptional regulator AlpA